MATGIGGFDDVTGGGLPRHRMSLVLGGPGSGKTIFGLQTLVQGRRTGRAGMFVAFEESTEQIRANASLFGWDLTPRSQGGALHLFDAQLSHNVIHGGAFDLAGLLAMLAASAQEIAADCIVFDGIDVLLAHLNDPFLVRREMFRLRDWIQDTGMTGIITAKKTRHGGDVEYLEFMADCVVSLEQTVAAGIAMRVLRVTKYRGAAHSANELPFAIGEAGIEVGGATSLDITHAVSCERVTSGVEPLDAMLGGGYFRGSSVLFSGAPGTAKTTLSAAFAAAACARRERTLMVSFDEAPEQIVRNMESVGIDLGRHRASGMLEICSLRSRAGGPEVHVARIRSVLQQHRARNLIVDPISALAQAQNEIVGGQAAIQILDAAKSRGITVVSTSLLADAASLVEQTPISISTIADTWLHVSYISRAGERNRALSVIKSRGMKHSNQVRELVLTSDGVGMADVYSAGGEVLMGTLRWEKENEARRIRESARRGAELREKEATYALAATAARLGQVQAEKAVREAKLERVKEECIAEIASTARDDVERVKQRSGTRSDAKSARTNKPVVGHGARRR